MKISYEQIEAYHNEIASVIENMKGIIEDIGAEVSSMTKNDVWSGAGASHFAFRYNNLLNAFDDIYYYLKQSNVYLEQSYINYKNVDEQIMRGLNF